SAELPARRSNERSQQRRGRLVPSARERAGRHRGLEPDLGGPTQLALCDELDPTAGSAENAGTQSYAQFKSTAGTRQNVVYVGANDGLLHGFRAGSYD